MMIDTRFIDAALMAALALKHIADEMAELNQNLAKLIAQNEGKGPLPTVGEKNHGPV